MLQSPQSDIGALAGAFADALETSWRSVARPEQLEPSGAWSIWAYIAGRGSGKTRSGAEWIIESVNAGHRELALVAPTAADARDIMVSGVSGILACSPDWNRPNYEPSKRSVTWPNGARALCFSADEPERLRGYNFSRAWVDELGSFKSDETWHNLMMTLRIGDRPRCFVSTTPRRTRVIRDLLSREGQDVVVTRGKTYDNADNLSPSFLRMMETRYGNTRLGRQELLGQLLEDIEGALWSRDMIEASRVRSEDVLQFVRVVVAIDPAVTSGEDSDETGIVVAALGTDGLAYILEDLSGRYQPHEWASLAVRAYHRHKADRVVAEVNQGGALVETTVRVVDPNVSFRGVHASKGKITRAEPVSALYERSRVKHVGAFPMLEDQMCEFAPGMSGSPDRLDALVWALTELMLGGGDNTAIIEFYRKLVEDDKRGHAPGAPPMPGEIIPMARLRAPDGTSTIYTAAGAAVNVGADGTFTIPQHDAQPLEAAGFTRIEGI